MLLRLICSFESIHFRLRPQLKLILVEARVLAIMVKLLRLGIRWAVDKLAGQAHLVTVSSMSGIG
jgi:hypothetical protein